MLVPVAAIPAVMLIGMIAGWIGGKYHERIAWNGLIKKGEG